MQPGIQLATGPRQPIPHVAVFGCISEPITRPDTASKLSSISSCCRCIVGQILGRPIVSRPCLRRVLIEKLQWANKSRPGKSHADSLSDLVFVLRAVGLSVMYTYLASLVCYKASKICLPRDVDLESERSTRLHTSKVHYSTLQACHRFMTTGDSLNRLRSLRVKS